MTDQKSPLKILFVCVANSCRSQMAEAFAKRLGVGKVLVWSAGSHPLGRMFSQTEVVLKERGIPLGGQWSKGVREVPAEEMDMVVTMGWEVAYSPPKGFKGRIIEWDIPDPYGGGVESFREVRDLIERQVVTLLNELPKLDPPRASGDVPPPGP
jgi:arsenate reductase (thioredoxin)